MKVGVGLCLLCRGGGVFFFFCAGQLQERRVCADEHDARRGEEQERARLVDWSSKLEALTAQRARLG